MREWGPGLSRISSQVNENLALYKSPLSHLHHVTIVLSGRPTVTNLI